MQKQEKPVNRDTEKFNKTVEKLLKTESESWMKPIKYPHARHSMAYAKHTITTIPIVSGIKSVPTN